jgi:hypothetical protein
MKTQFKDVPWGVYVASIFLVLVWVMMCFVYPAVLFSLTFSIGTLLSILRVLHYLSHGN